MTASASNRLELIEKSKFANDNSTEIRTQLKALVDSGEIKLREISRFTTFEPSTISQALNNKYEGDVEKLDDALRRFYRNYVAKFAIIQTRVVVDIHETMQLAWKRREIALIRGPFGRGKSKAAHRFCALNDYAAFLELTSSTSSVSILHRIAEALGVEGQMSGSQDDKLHAIIRSLQRKPRLLIVDEADELKPRTLAILRDIHGEKTERCGMVLVRNKPIRQAPPAAGAWIFTPTHHHQEGKSAKSHPTKQKKLSTCGIPTSTARITRRHTNILSHISASPPW